MDDIEQYRLPHESCEEWRLRRAFLAAHQHRFSRNRLICLASCFISVECYGCSYPEPVMDQLTELAAGLRDAIDECRTDVLEGKAKVELAASDKSSEDEETKRKRDLEGSFNVLSMTMTEVTDRHCIKNDVELMQMSMQKAKVSFTAQVTNSPGGGYTCELVINDVFIASVTTSGKKSAKHEAFSKAADILRKLYLRVDTGKDGRLELKGSDLPFSHASNASNTSKQKQKFDITPMKLGRSSQASIQPLARHLESVKIGPSSAVGRLPNKQQQPRKRPAATSEFVLKDFVLLKVMVGATGMLDQEQPAVCILQQSSAFNKQELQYEFSESGSQCRCQLLLGTRVISDVVSTTKTAAKTLAAEQALKTLSFVCCTIVAKRPQDTLTDDAVKRNEVLNTETAPASIAIPDSNIGSQLLKKMGWTGGGVGKEGNRGIEEPISLEAVINRAGLGLHSKSSELLAAIKRVISDYVRSDRHDDLIFSPEFTKEERAVIHAEARKHHLRTRSYGRNEERYLILSLQRSPIQLVEHIRQNGGETAKYIVQEPGS